MLSAQCVVSEYIADPSNYLEMYTAHENATALTQAHLISPVHSAIRVLPQEGSRQNIVDIPAQTLPEEESGTAITVIRMLQLVG